MWLSAEVDFRDLMVFEPKISIVIPVYNGANYLRVAVDSALRQTYENVEVIVVNDGSNDGDETENIAKSYGNRIRYFYKENGGVASALNFGIERMTGDYFSWLSHDDLYYPLKVEKQVDYLRLLDDPDVVLYGDFEFVDKKGDVIGQYRIENRIAENPLRAILSTSVHGCSILVPRKAFESTGLFNEGLRTIQDNEMWLRIYKHGFNFLHIPEVLIQSRVHEEQGQLSLRHINRLETVRFYSWAFEEMGESIVSDAGEILEILAGKGINLPLGVLRRGTGLKNGRIISWLMIVAYKNKVYLRMIKDRLRFSLLRRKLSV